MLSVANFHGLPQSVQCSTARVPSSEVTAAFFHFIFIIQSFDTIPTASLNKLLMTHVRNQVCIYTYRHDSVPKISFKKTDALH